jgi:hypothetical protein
MKQIQKSSHHRLRLLLAFLLTISACVDTVKAQVIYITGNTFGSLDLATYTYTQLSPTAPYAIAIGPGGVIYTVMAGGIGIFNPATGTETLFLPIPGFSANGIGFAPDGTLYACGAGLWQINLIAGTYSFLGAFTNGVGPLGDIAVLNGEIYFSGYNTNTATFCVALVDLNDIANPQCVETINLFGLFGLTAVNAQYCDDKLYGSGYDGNTEEWAIYSYNPALIQTGVTYYAASIAGNALPNGNVNLTDPCLDISNPVPVIWRAKPSVVFSTSNPDLCAGDCRTIQVNFTGAAPFVLTISDPVQGNSSLTFPGNTGTFNICPPIGTPPGNLQIQATALTDAFCSCE